MRKLLFGALCAGLCALALNAAAPPSERADEPADEVDDTQDVLYMGQPHPVLLRLHLRVDRRSAFSHYDDCMARYFAFLDRNGNKTLDRVEASRAPSVQEMRQFFAGNLFLNSARPGVLQAAVKFTDFDADTDGQVTLDEFKDYYARSGAGPIVLQAQNAGNVNMPGFDPNTGQPARADALTDLVFAILDADKDGKLSREELRAAERLLLKYDIDDNEMVSAAELGGRPTRRIRRLGEQAAARRPRPVPPKQPARPSNLMLIPRGDSGKRMTEKLKIARELIGVYDKNKDGVLDPSEISFPKEAFASVDRNRDGKLNALELGRWLAGKAGGEFVVRMSDLGDSMMRRGGGGMMAPKFKRDDLALNLEGIRINVVSPPSTASYRNDQFLIQQFETIDAANKGFITRRDVDADAQGQGLRGLFELGDRNNDGRLTEKEFRATLKVLGGMRGAQINVSMASTGQGLFQMIDTNGDGQLSVREMRNVVKQLAALDRDRDGFISRDEFPHQYQLTVSQGPSYAFNNGMPQTPVVVPRAGPVWFRKMDRNADGDISLSEWLGTKEQFAEIDTDRDGLIGLEEAEAYDARERQKGE